MRLAWLPIHYPDLPSKSREKSAFRNAAWYQSKADMQN
jgi:hypothetical protein